MTIQIPIPLQAAQKALEALYLIGTRGGGAEYLTAHEQIKDSLNTNLSFEKEHSFDLEIKYVK